MYSDSQEIRRSILAKWHETLSKHGNLFSSDSISGTSPPSVFVGSYNYPKVFVGPMVPPAHGDTSILDSPERWKGKSLEDIVNFRLNLVRGIQKISVNKTEGRYIENLQEVVMSSQPIDSDLIFEKSTSSHISLDGESAPFGPTGIIHSAKFSGTTSEKSIEKTFYDKDMKAQDAVLNLYNSGIEISKIQKCFSIGMLGQKRKLVPTKWSITATDDIISKSLVDEILDYSIIDSCKIFSYEHLGNVFVIVLFPHRWIYEMIEAWYSNGILGFGSDYEDARGIDHPPAVAGAYFAAKLGVLEYLAKNKIQSGVVILREIRPEYAIPVGVWQVREGVREAMKQKSVLADNFDDAILLASNKMSISKSEWLANGNILKLIHQKTLSDFF
ncbi:Nre family DNA repair protein [Nitrosopumilus zosterae]|uniref:Nre family DNA repair protein n=1 Tax=Nitrosopumilus zosterae TaxID=718286 RepID=UPI000D6F97EB|nr:Nre family DNA repair protein [Nitrosopumilus zosterae]BDQ30789.1 Nre family DNA repair protein [Nitrosopumilus zosterae]